MATTGRKTEFNIEETQSTTTGKSMKFGHQAMRQRSFFGVTFEDDENKPDFSRPEKRTRFVIVIYLIVTLQILFTIFCTLPFAFWDQAQTLVFDNTWVIFVFLVILIVPYFMLVCCESTRREFPTNIVLLVFLTLGMAGTCASCSAWFETVVIAYSLVLTLIITITITILAIVASSNFTTWRWILGTVVIFLIVFVSAALFLSSTTKHPLKTFIYPGIVMALFIGFLLYDTNAIMSGHRYIHITPTSFIAGAAQIYVDVVGLFITFLEIVGTITEND